METKICTKCKLEKPITEFNNNKYKSDGKQSECKECHKLLCTNYYNRNKQHYRDNSRRKRKKIYDYLNNIKSVGCYLCNEKDIACLDFHHLDSKYDQVSHMQTHSMKLINDEIDKCIVLCSNCHRKLHFHKLTIEELKQRI